MADRKKSISLWSVIKTIILIAFLMFAYHIYKENNFNDFKKAKADLTISNFKRDSEIKYSDTDSYKIESEEFNDIVFYQKIELKPYTPYRVTCMVKTQDIKTENESFVGGAHISIVDTVETSKSITGTNDWQEIELLFNSKNREQVEIGFRLGGYDDKCTGTAWFSDFKIEEGIKEEDTNWNFACFVFPNIDVTLNDGTEVRVTMTPNDIRLMEENIRRFGSSCTTLSRKSNEC